MSNQEILELAQKINDAFNNIPVNAILSIWCVLKDLPLSTFDDNEATVEKVAPKTCQHMYIKGAKANTQCKVKVKGGGEFCSKHKP